MSKIKVGGIIAVIAVLTLVVSLVMPWFSMTTEYEDESSTNRIFLSLFSEHSRTDDDTDEITSTYNITSWIAMLASIFSVISLFFIGMALGGDSGKHAKIGSVFLVIGLILAIVAPIYLMVSQPNAFLEERYDGDEDNLPDRDTLAESFFGSHSPDNQVYEESWRGGIGWFMSLIGGILLVFSVVLVAKGGKSTSHKRPMREEYPRQQRPQQRQWGPRQQEPGQQEPRQESGQQPQQQQVQQEPRQQQAQYQQTQQQSNTCPDCGRPVRYIEEYDSWYCDNCQEYR